MSFRYDSSFKTSPPEAYERLLHDALDGDHTLFIREDEVERGWAVVQPVLDDPPPIVTYRAGSWGPKEADALVRPLHWHDVRSGRTRMTTLVGVDLGGTNIRAAVATGTYTHAAPAHAATPGT